MWVNERMNKITEEEDLAEELKLLKAKQRLNHMQRNWSVMEQRRQQMVNENRLAQIGRLRPLTSMGIDVERLVMSERISPLEHRNLALADSRQMVAQRDRQRQAEEIKLAKEQVRLQDLGLTRKTAEDRAESLWRMQNMLPLHATMDSITADMMAKQFPGDAAETDAQCYADNMAQDNEAPMHNMTDDQLVSAQMTADKEMTLELEQGQGHMTV